MRQRLGTLVTGSVALAAALIVAAVGGCSSTTIPVPLSETQRARVEATHFNGVVGVERHVNAQVSELLLESLRSTGLFDQVGNLGELETEPDLIARVGRSMSGTATLPILTGLSLGIIPTTVEEEYGHSFSLRSPNDAGYVGLIEFHYRGSTTLGWLATILNLQSERASGSPYANRQFLDAFALEIVSHADAIQAIIE